MIQTQPSLPSTPSISVRSWFTTRLELPPSPPEPELRLGARLSTSSKKMTQGRLFLALRNTDLTALSLSPTYMLINSGPFTLIKLIPASLAIALATKVLPQPGGPTSKTPEEDGRPRLSNCCLWLTGVKMESWSSSLTFSRAPTSAQVTSGTVTNPSRLAEGCTILRAVLQSPSSIYNLSRSVSPKTSVSRIQEVNFSRSLSEDSSVEDDSRMSPK